MLWAFRELKIIKNDDSYHDQRAAGILVNRTWWAVCSIAVIARTAEALTTDNGSRILISDFVTLSGGLKAQTFTAGGTILCIKDDIFS